MITKRLLPFLFLFVCTTTQAQFEGNALDFDGSNDAVIISTVPPLFSSPSTNDFTIEAWVNPYASVFSRIFFAQPSTANFVTFGPGAGNVIYFYVVSGGTTYSVATSTSIPQNQWTHVAVRWTSATSTPEVFFDGVLQPGAPGGGSSTGTSGLVTLGTRPGGGTQYFSGALDELRVWNEARTPCEIQSNMNNSITGTQTNLVMNYDFNQGVGGGSNAGVTTLPDLSGAAFDGVLTNFALTGATSNWITSLAIVTTSGNPQGGVVASEVVAVCSGQSYTFPDGSTSTNITSTINHLSTLIAFSGCDSLLTTTVNVNPTYSDSLTIVVCSGEDYTFPDSSTTTNITSTTIHVSSLTSFNGCDSLITTTVNVNPTYSDSTAVTVCSGNDYTFPDGSTATNITSATNHVSTLITVAGCDSVIVTTVSVNSVYASSEADSVCFGGSYTFPDSSVTSNITVAMMHTSTFSTMAGCDSIITTNISIIPVNTSVTQAGTMLIADEAGATYQWLDCGNAYAIIATESGQTYTPLTGGSYAVQVTINGCTDTSMCFSSSVGVDELSASQIVVYPNPAKDAVMVRFSKNTTGTIELIGISGAVVRTMQFNGSGCSFDLSEIAEGFYQMSIRTPEGNVMKPVVKIGN